MELSTPPSTSAGGRLPTPRGRTRAGDGWTEGEYPPRRRARGKQAITPCEESACKEVRSPLGAASREGARSPGSARRYGGRAPRQTPAQDLSRLSRGRRAPLPR